MRRLFAAILLAATLAASGNAEQSEEEAPANRELVIDTVKMFSAHMNYTMTEAERTVCAGKNGKVSRRGFLNAETCIVPYADAGKSCTNYDQCQGRCLWEGRRSPPKGTLVVGQCEATNDFFGCKTFVSDGKIDQSMCFD